MPRVKDSELSIQCRKLLVFIHEYKAQHPYSPDIRDMAAAVPSRQEKELSTSVVNYYLAELEQRGLISFLYLKTRLQKQNRHARAARTVYLTEEGKAYVEALLKVRIAPARARVS